jgi:hypothetical protein
MRRKYEFFTLKSLNSRHSVIIQAVSRLHLSVRFGVISRANQCEIFGSHTVIETGFCPSISVFVLALGFGPSTSVVVRILPFSAGVLRFLYWYLGFCPSTRFLSEHTSFSLFVSFLRYVIFMFFYHMQHMLNNLRSWQRRSMKCFSHLIQSVTEMLDSSNLGSQHQQHMEVWLSLKNNNSKLCTEFKWISTRHSYGSLWTGRQPL